jgi:hypothetical protein
VSRHACVRVWSERVRETFSISGCVTLAEVQIKSRRVVVTISKQIITHFVSQGKKKLATESMLGAIINGLGS